MLTQCLIFKRYVLIKKSHATARLHFVRHAMSCVPAINLIERPDHDINLPSVLVALWLGHQTHKIPTSGLAYFENLKDFDY